MDQARPPNSQRTAYLHFASRFPFPVNPIFFGQTFVIGNLTAATRYANPYTEKPASPYATNPYKKRNYVFLRDAVPLSEPLLGEKAQKLSRARFNATLKVGYSIEAIDQMASFVRKQAEEGYHSVMLFHFPVSPDTEFAYALRRALEAGGLSREHSMIFYLHTNADSHYHRPEDEAFSRYHLAMCRAADGVIGVSQAVRDNFVKIRVRDGEGEASLNPDTSLVVRNGIDPHIYTIRDEKEICEARRELGLADGLEKVVSFVGRMDRLKGSDYLIKVLEHFEASTDQADAKVGFVIATPHVLNIDMASKPFRGLLRMKRLISENRLKVVLDISKFTRGDERFRDDVEGILRSYAEKRGLSSALGDPLFRSLYGGMTNIPIQTISDVYLHPSRSEAFGLAVLEGVFSGAYVVSTRVGGIPEIVVDPRLGTLVPLDSDKNVFVKKLIMAICGAEPPRSFDRAGLEAYFASYTDRSMFDGFESAVSRIRGVRS